MQSSQGTLQVGAGEKVVKSTFALRPLPGQRPNSEMHRTITSFKAACSYEPELMQCRDGWPVGLEHLAVGVSPGSRVSGLDERLRAHESL